VLIDDLQFGVYLGGVLIRRTRVLFSILLAFALLPIVSMTVTGPAAARTHASPAWMPWTAKSQSTVQPARDAGAATKHHPDAAPFTAAEAFNLGLNAPGDATAPATPSAIAAGAPLTHHPARAPPALL
jgi:hypothetical protein